MVTNHQPAPTAKRDYQSPRLTTYGKVRDLTAAGTKGLPEGNSSSGS